jgi:hypothetical protein
MSIVTVSFAAKADATRAADRAIDTKVLGELGVIGFMILTGFSGFLDRMTGFSGLTGEVEGIFGT